MRKSKPKAQVISIDEATAILDKAPKRIPDEAYGPDDDGRHSGETDEDLAAAPPAADADGAETQTESEDPKVDEGEGPEEDDSEQAELEPPRFWDAEDKERFGELPRDVQEIILRKEDERNAATARVLQEAAEKRKALEADGTRLGQLLQGLDILLPHAMGTFQHRWNAIDWNKVASQHGADQALKLRGQMQREQHQIQQLHAAKGRTDAAKFRDHMIRETDKLHALSPELAHPKLGVERKTALKKFLTNMGVPAGRIARLSAHEAALAYDAMRWRNGQEAADALAAVKPTAQSRRTPAKPTAATGPRSTNQARIGSLAKKRELSIEEAVELANLKGLI